MPTVNGGARHAGSRARPRVPTWARRLVVALVVLVVVVIAAKYIVDRRHQLVHDLADLSWSSVVLSALCALVALVTTMLSWRSVVLDLGMRLPLRDAARVYFVGQAGKYLPGSVWPVLAQAQLARRRNISPVQMGSASLVALALSVATSGVIGSVLLPVSTTHAARTFWWVPLLAIPLLVLMWPPVLNRVIRRAARVLRRPEPAIGLSLRGLGRAASWSAISVVLFGGHLYFLERALGAGSFRDFLLGVCAFGLAAAVGIVIIFAPAGAGPREIVLTAVLAPSLSSASALAIALVSRVILIVLDLLVAAVQVPGLRRWSTEVTSEQDDVPEVPAVSE